MIVFEYQIANLDVQDIGDITNVVTAIHYRVIAKSSDYDFSPVHSGVENIDLNDGSFVEFELLEKDDVLRWLKKSIDCDSIEKSLILQFSGDAVVQYEQSRSSIPYSWH